jgi:outer membrane lipoprotein-sorting protein
MATAMFVLVAIAFPLAPVAADPEAEELVRKLEDVLRSNSSIGVYRVEVVRPSWSRVMRMKYWDDRIADRFFIRLLAPKKDKDTTFLKVGGNLWMYLPKLERDIKLPPSMMLNSWMGSDFTNDDLVKQSSTIDDYTHRVIDREGEGETAIITIESLPKPEAPVVWGKLVMRLRPDGMPVDQVFFDERGTAVRRINFEKVGMLGGRRTPTQWTVVPLDEPDNLTVLVIEEAEFDIPIAERTFQRANLSRSER